MRITEYMANRHAEAVRLANAKTALATAIEGKGVTVPEGTKLDGMAALVESIEAGGGGFQVALGTFIPAETKSLNSLPPASIEHNAGFTPDAFIFYQADTGNHGIIAVSAKATILWGEESMISYACYVMAKGASSMGEENLTHYPPTGEVVYIRSSVSTHKITAGQEYRWIAIGGI